MRRLRTPLALCIVAGSSRIATPGFHVCDLPRAAVVIIVAHDIVRRDWMKARFMKNARHDAACAHHSCPDDILSGFRDRVR